jgi:competence ComEA-like helix-hairpin-helix protein
MAGPTRNRFDELLADPTSKPGEGSTKRKARKLLAQGGTTPEAERQKLDERVNDPLVDIYPDLQRLREGKPLGGEWADKFAESEDELQRKLQAIAESNLPDREKERLIDEGSKRLDKPFWMDALDFIDKPDAMARSFLNQVVRQFDSDDDPMWNWSWDGFWKGVDDNISWNEILANRDLGFTNYILGGAEPMRGRGNAQVQDNPDGWGGLAQGIFTFFLDMATSPTTYLGGAGKGVTRLTADKGLELSRNLGRAAKIETELGNALEANKAATLAARSFEVGGLRGLSQAERKGAEAALRRANLLPTDVKNLKGGAYLGVGNARVLIPGSRQVAAVTTRPLNVGIASLRNSRAGKTAAKPFSTVFRQLAAQIQSGDQARVAQAMETQTQLLLARADSALWMTNANAELDGIVREIKRLKVDPEELSYFLEDVAASAQGLNPSAGKLYVQYTENPKVQKLVARIQDWQSQVLRNNFNDIVGEEVIDDLENYVPTLMSKDFLDLVNKKKPVTSIFTEADWQRGTKFKVGNEYLGEMIVPTELHPKNFTPKMQGEDILRRNYGDEFIGALYDRNWIKAARTRVFVAQGRLEGELIARNMRKAGVGFTAEQVGKMASPRASMGETMRQMGWQGLASQALAARQAAKDAGVAADTAGTKLLADLQVLDEIASKGGTLRAMTDQLDETGRFIAERSMTVGGLVTRRRQLAERIRQTETKLNTSVERMAQRVKRGGAATPQEQQAAARLTAWAMGIEPDDIARLNERWNEVDAQLAKYMAEADVDANDVARVRETVDGLLSGSSARLDTVNELLKAPQASIGSDEILRRTKLQAEKVDLEESVAALRAMKKNLRATDDSVRELNRIRDGFDAEIAFEQGRKRIIENTTLTSAQKRAAMRALHTFAPPMVRRAPYGRALDRLIEVGEKGRLLRPNGELAEFVATPKGMRLAKAQGGVEDLTIDALSGAAGREAASEFIGRTVYYSDDAVASGMDAKDIRRIQVNVAMKNPRVIAGVDDADRIINAEMLLTAVDAKLVQLDQLADLTNTQQVFVDEISAVFARHAQAVNAADSSEAVLRFIDDLDDTLGKLAFGGGTPSGPLPSDPAERLIAKMRLSVAATPNPIAAEFVQRAGARIADQGLTPGAVDEIRRQLDDLEVMVTDNSEELLLRQYDRIDELKRKIEAPAEPAVADEVAATADEVASAPNTAALPASEPVRGPGDVPLSPSPQVDEASQALLAEQREIVNEVDEALDAMFDIDARYADDTTPNFFWNGFDLRTDEGIRELKKVVDAVHKEVKETLRSIPLGNKAQAKALKIPRPGLGFIEDYIPDAWRKQPGFNQAFPNYEGGANDDWWFDLLPDSKKWNSAKRELEDAKRSMQGMSRGHPDYKKLAANKAQASKRVNALRKNLVDLLRYSYFDEADGRWLPNRDNLRETGVLLPEHEMAYLDNIVEGPSDEAREAAMAELEKRAIGFGFTGLTPNAGVSSVPFDQAFTSFVRDSGGVRLVDQLDGVIDPNDTSTWWDVLQYRSKAKDAEEKQIDYLRRVVIERKTPGSGSDLDDTGMMIADEYNRELADVGIRLSTLKQVEGLTPMLERWRDFASDMPNSIRRFVAGEADPELKLFFQSLNAQSPNRGQLWRIANELYLGRLQADEAASAAATAAAAKETEKLARNVRLQRLRKSGDDNDRLASAIETTILARRSLDLEEPAKLADEYVNLVRSITGSTDAVDERFLAQLKSSPTETMTGRVAQLRDEAVSADLEIGELVGDVSVMAKEVAMREAFVAAIQRAVWGETISGEELAALGWRNSQTVTKLTDLANQARTLRGEVANIAPPQKLAAFMLIDELVSPAMTSMSPKRAEELLAMSPGSGPLLAKLGYTPEMVGAAYRSKLKKLGYDGILVDDLARRSATVFDEKQVRPASKVAKIEAELETLQMQARKSIRDNQRKLISLSDQAFGFRIDRQSDKPADALAVAADNMKKLLALDSTDANSAERLLRIQAHEAFSRADDLQLGRTPTTQDAPAAASDPMDISFSMQNAGAPSQLPAGEGSSVMGASALRLQGQAFAAEADMLASGRGPSKLMDGNLASTPGLAEQIAAINDMGFKQLDRQTFAEPWLVDILVDANRLSSPAEIKKLLRAADYATNVFKGYAILSPGFHIRNFFGGLMNNWLAGVDVRNYVNFFRSEKIYFAELRKTGKAEMALQAVDKAMGKKGGDAYRQWHRMESASGMGLAGAFAQDAGRSTSALATDKAGSFLGDMGRAISAGRYGPREQILSLSDNALIRANGYAAQRVERFLRGSLAYDTFYTRGGDITSATLRVRKYHFDYNDVSAFEANYLRRIIPFYVWISRNVPLQIEGLIRKPKVALSYYRLKNAIEAQSEEDAYVSSWYGREGAIRLPFKQDGFNRYLFTELPLMDLGIIDSPMEYLTSAVTPYLKVPVELAANKRFFTNQPFRNELVELPPKYEETKVAEALVKSGLAERGADGVARIDERYLYTMEQGFPLLGVLNRLLDPTRAANTWLSKGLGFTIRTNDDRSQNSEIRRRISWLNDEGDKYQSLQYDLKETSRRSKTDNTRRVELNAERLLYERDFLLRAANTYDAKALADLPEISENAARWIVANRATNGSFKTLDDIVKAKIPDFERTNINSMLLALAEKPETMGIPKPKVVDLNSSGIDELEQLPGVGPSTAKKIIDYRRTYGGFKNIDDLRNIKGLPDADVDAIRDYFLEDLMKRATPEYRKYMQQAGYRPLQELVLTP